MPLKHENEPGPAKPGCRCPGMEYRRPRITNPVLPTHGLPDRWTLFRFLTPCLAACMLLSCASEDPKDEFRDPARETPPPAGAAEVMKVEIPAENSVTVTLAGAAWLALARNRSLAALREEIRSRTGEVIQADQAPNPRISVSAQTPVGDGIRIGGSIELSQVIELGKRSARVATAASEREVAKALYFLRRNQVLLEVNRAVVDAQAAAAELALLARLLDLRDKAHKLKADMLGEGRIDRRAEIDSAVALEKARLAVESSRRKLKDAARAVEALCDLPPHSLRGVEGAMAEPSDLPPEARLQRAAVTGNPYLVSLDRKAALAASRLRAAEIKPVPDFSIGASYMHKREAGEEMDVVGLGISIPVPAWDQNAGEVKAWTAAVAALREDRKEGENRTLLELSREINLHGESMARVRNYSGTILPAFEKKLALTVLEHEAGRASFADEISAQIELIEASIELLAARKACLLSEAEVEALTGSVLETGGGEE